MDCFPYLHSYKIVIRRMSVWCSVEIMVLMDTHSGSCNKSLTANFHLNVSVESGADGRKYTYRIFSLSVLISALDTQEHREGELNPGVYTAGVSIDWIRYPMLPSRFKRQNVWASSPLILGRNASRWKCVVIYTRKGQWWHKVCRQDIHQTSVETFQITYTL